MGNIFNFYLKMKFVALFLAAALAAEEEKKNPDTCAANADCVEADTKCLLTTPKEGDATGKCMNDTDGEKAIKDAAEGTTVAWAAEGGAVKLGLAAATLAVASYF